LNWISYYLDRGFSDNYLLNLSEIEKIFYIESMNYQIESKVNYDLEKIKITLKAIFGDKK